MPWYYAHNNMRLGPVSDTEFARLAREKIILDDTLVWKYGMTEWKTYAEVAATLPSIETVPPLPEAHEGHEPATSAASVLAGQPVRLDYAGFGVRFGAKAVDLLILNFLVLFIAQAAGVWHQPPPVETMDQFFQVLREMNALARVAFVVSMIYQWLFLRLFAATPGKLIFGLKVVRADGNPLSLLQVVARPFVEILNQFTLFTGYLVAAFDDERRAMHDHICGTRVIKKRRG